MQIRKYIIFPFDTKIAVLALNKQGAYPLNFKKHFLHELIRKSTMCFSRKTDSKIYKTKIQGHKCEQYLDKLFSIFESSESFFKVIKIVVIIVIIIFLVCRRVGWNFRKPGNLREIGNFVLRIGVLGNVVILST